MPTLHPEIAAAMLEGDRLDARAMVAREVYAERQWRIESAIVHPRMTAAIDAHGDTVRELVERQCGEPVL